MRQRDKVLMWLWEHEELTFRDAVVYLNIMDVRKRIQELREEGYNIITIPKKSASGAHFGAYKLIEEEE